MSSQAEHQESSEEPAILLRHLSAIQETIEPRFEPSNDDTVHDFSHVSNAPAVIIEPTPTGEEFNKEKEVVPEELLQSSASTVVAFDIEHVAVQDDPRAWSRTKKLINLGVVSFSAIAPTLAVNLYNPAFKQIEHDLHASQSDIALSLSLFIIMQGNAPLIWSAVSEIKGRKGVYIVSMFIFAVGSIVAALAKRISILIGMRILQAVGSSSVLNVAAGTLADMYEPHERGTIMGLYYAAPLLGPAIGPIVGGALTSAFSWRATFWFLVIFAGLALLSYFFLFKETFRKERSRAYQGALRRATAEKAKKALQHQETAKHSEMKAGHASLTPQTIEALVNERTKKDVQVSQDEIQLSILDIDILNSLWVVVRERNNFVILLASSLTFAFQYGICYTAAITFAAPPYNYGPIIIGCILLAFGVGCVGGSVFGGKWSDKVLKEQQLKASLHREDAEGNLKTTVSSPEMRLRSTLLAMPLLPPSIIAYAWMAHFHVNVAGPTVMLFLTGFSATWIYSSTLTYIVDANNGRSSTAVAANSSFRGTMGFVIAEISAPLQNALGDGGLYTIWAGVIVMVELFTLLVMYRGAKWRAASEAKATARAIAKNRKALEANRP